jgi:ABC-2 type transport system permease protein
MFRSLQIEWMKIKNYRVFQVFSVLYLLGIVLIVYVVYKFYMEMMRQLMSAATKRAADAHDIFRLFSSDTIWQTVCFWTGLLLYLPGMIIIMLFINEVNFKTHRQNIIDGWKRETFIYTKIGLIVCISLAVTIMNIVATFVMCQVTGIEFSILSGLDTLVYCFIQAFVYLMFALLLATFFRKSGIAIIVFIIYGFVLESFLVVLLNKFLPGAYIYFLPLQVADSLIPFPPMKDFYANMPSGSVLLVGAIAMLGLYVFLTVRKYKYDDL